MLTISRTTTIHFFKSHLLWYVEISSTRHYTRPYLHVCLANLYFGSLFIREYWIEWNMQMNQNGLKVWTFLYFLVRFVRNWRWQCWVVQGRMTNCCEFLFWSKKIQAYFMLLLLLNKIFGQNLSLLATHGSHVSTANTIFIVHQSNRPSQKLWLYIYLKIFFSLELLF